MKVLIRLWTIVELFGRFLREFFRLAGGVWTLSNLEKPIVSVFGGSKVAQEHLYAKKAAELAGKLMAHNISVITGGGPGIMQAANCGAFEYQGSTKRTAKSIGISVTGLPQEARNYCADDYVVTNYFVTRKYLLTRYATAFALFPGGYGTMDELFEILTLMQTNKQPRVPIVLIESRYWQPIIAWCKEAVKEGLLLPEDADLLFVTDDIDEAVKHLHQQCQHVILR